MFIKQYPCDTGSFYWQELGARIMAQIVLKEIKAQQPGLAECIVKPGAKN